MNGDAGLVGCLVGRLATRLPHRTGNHGASLAGDEIVAITTTTLVKVSNSSVLLVLDALLALIEELARPYSRNAATHPPHVLLSELYVLALLAQCCTSHWDSVPQGDSSGVGDAPRKSSAPGASVSPSPSRRRQSPPPVAVDAALARRVFEVVKMFLTPPPDGHVLSAKTLLDDRTPPLSGGVAAAAAAAGASSATLGPGETPRTPVSARSDDAGTVDAAQTLEAHAVTIEAHVRAIVEYVSAASWKPTLDHLKTVVYKARTALSSPAPPPQGLAALEEERSALVVLRLVSFFWVDRQRLGQVLQELCASFLHLRRPFQNTVAVAAPLLVLRWIERCPAEFVELHELHLRVDGTPESLFDMAAAATDNGRRKALLLPLQTVLVLLLPDVFEVASNMREAKGGSVAKKVAFLEGLRKMLRNNKNEQAAYCLVALLRAARHFDAAADPALLSYAMDFQDEVREALFRKVTAPADAASLDQDLLTAAFVSLAHLRFDTCVDTLAARCLAPTMPLPFKIAVIQACSHFSRLEDAAAYEPLFNAASAFVQYQMRAMAAQLTSTYANASSLQKSDHSVPNATICSILEFLRASPATLFQGEPSDAKDSSDAFFRDNLQSFMACLVVSDETVRRLAVHVAPHVFTPDVVQRYKTATARLPTNSFRRSFWKLTSLVLASLCDRVSPYRLEAGLKNIHNYLESRLLLLRSIPGLSELAEEVPERTTCSVKLETLFLVSLCSADIETCQLVTSCIDFFLEECRIIDTASKGAKSSSTLLRNDDVFREIASKEFRFTGVVAFQRRVDGLLKKMQVPSSGIVTAWELVFDRWLHLSKDVSTIAPEVLPERTLVEWRNCSGFLASVGGICTAGQTSILEETVTGGNGSSGSTSGGGTNSTSGGGGGSGGSGSGLRWIDRVLPDGPEEPLLNRFLRLSIQLLASANVRVREAMRELLSFEISPTLYQVLFKTLDSELDILFTGVLEQSSRGSDSEVIFAEQAVSLLRALIERLDSPSDLGAASSVQLGALSLNFVKFLNTTPDVPNSLRVKIKTCQLCEAVTKRKEHLNLRDDVRVRNQLLDHIFGWIARPHSPPSTFYTAGAGSGRQQDEAVRVQKDLDRACLKCLAELTYRLPLQPTDGQSDAGTSELKSHMFHTYFNRFLSLLNMEQAELARSGELALAGAGASETSSSELAITILSNLLSSNLDVGLKRSLSIGYHENMEVRTAFVRVLCNILMQGTEFSSLSDLAATDKYDDLIGILTNDTSLATAMTAACPSAEVDELTISLLNVFERQGLVFDVLEAVIRQEIDETDNETELFRRASVATKMLTVYAKWKGAAYLKSTLQKVVERLMLTANDLDFELDPDRVKSTADLEKNALQLQVVAKVFIDDICASASRMPASFRKICHIINTAVSARFPEAKYTAVGAFIFLRFFCPAVVAPEVEGLVTQVPSKAMRRSLLLITKVIQNLANNVLFGAKESYMFPLNHFLSENIFDVTAFLRTISEVPQTIAPRPAGGTAGAGSETDFGAAVSLHRFLYDHWDSVRQRLVAQERRDHHVRSPGEGPGSRPLVLEPLRNLITNLGPPPLAITWNRPQITLNSPPAYSAFQNFMLRNAFGSTDSFVTARAVYDGGERIDGMSMICIILRYIDVDSIDFDTLLYSYLKIASRLWHKPFGLFIDATCYSGQNEPQDQLFQKLEALTPTELARQLSHVYIYNMNSTFRKCFRRILRTAARNGGGVFHPDNVEYHLYSNLQDLQGEFHLSKLHLPKETLSFVSDTRFVFQPTTRLSRSRGRIEVGIHVGSQFVQVTTTQKQEIHQGFGLSAIFNDIFRLGDIEQASVSMQTDDESAFGLRADNGRVVMYFSSPRKQDILQAIRGAKAKYRDARGVKLLERLVRPQDVPGTLLNLALANLGSADAMLRLSSYNLLGALCRTFQFSAASSLLCTKDISVPLDPSRFIVDISTRLAQSEPQLTMDFLNEFFVGWDSVPEEQKPLSLAYMAPWLPGLRTSVLPAEAEGGDKARDKIAGLFRKLIDVALSDPSLSFVLEKTVWPAIYQDETLLDLFLEEVVKNGLALGTHGAHGAHNEQTESLTAIVTGMGTLTLRGKIMARLRKALNRTSLRPTKHLPDNAVWAEICVLLQFCVALSFGSGVQAQLYLAEVFHVVTLLANTGTANVRFLVHRLLTNSLHAVCTSFALDEARLVKLRGALESLSEGKTELFPGAVAAAAAVTTTTPAGFGRDGALSMVTAGQESGGGLAGTEALAGLLFELCSVAAPSVDIANGWRARWMSLVASTAFQNNPAIQPRAFTVMGCLAREEVDDDLLYQVLVALRTSIGRFSDDGSSGGISGSGSASDMLVAIVTALSKMLGRLPAASRYGYQLFWLAMSLLRLVPVGLFNCTALFLEAVLANISASGEMRGERMVPFLLQGRVPLEEAALALDEACGIHFTSDNFHFAACACLVRGLTDTMTKTTALRVVSTLLALTSWTGDIRDGKAPAQATQRGAGAGVLSRLSGSPYLALILARVGTSEELRDSLWHVGVGAASVPSLDEVHTLQDLETMKEKDLLLNMAMELVDFRYLEDAIQHRTLLWLNELAREKANVVLHLCAPIASILDDVLLHCQNSSTLAAAHELLQTLSSNAKFSQVLDAGSMAGLEDMRFGGLWKSCTFSNAQEPDAHCFGLTERLIEVC